MQQKTPCLRAVPLCTGSYRGQDSNLRLPRYEPDNAIKELHSFSEEDDGHALVAFVLIRYLSVITYES